MGWITFPRGLSLKPTHLGELPESFGPCLVSSVSKRRPISHEEVRK